MSSLVVPLSIENQFPTVDSVTLSPNLVYTNDTIIAAAISTDPDSSQSLTLTYEWHVIDASTGSDVIVQTGAF